MSNPAGMGRPLSWVMAWICPIGSGPQADYGAPCLALFLEIYIYIVIIFSNV